MTTKTTAWRARRETAALASALRGALITADRRGRAAGDRVGDDLNRRWVEGRVERHREHLAADAIGHRAVGRSFRSQSGLLWNRHRIVDQRFDTLGLEVGLHRL